MRRADVVANETTQEPTQWKGSLFDVNDIEALLASSIFKKMYRGGMTEVRKGIRIINIIKFNLR
jgi:hypothetical protein